MNYFVCFISVVLIQRTCDRYKVPSFLVFRSSS